MCRVANQADARRMLLGKINSGTLKATDIGVEQGRNSILGSASNNVVLGKDNQVSQFPFLALAICVLPLQPRHKLW